MSYQDGRDSLSGNEVDEPCTKENLPPVADNELEFSIPHARDFQNGQQIRSDVKTVGNFSFRILVFPCGTTNSGPTQVSAFVEADPHEGLDSRWLFSNVKYQIVLVNWKDYRKSIYKTDGWSFSKEGIDRGWHDIIRTSELTLETGWLGPGETLYFRAACCVKQADTLQLGSDYNCRRETGHIGLMNHGATCYMNGLLQSLFHVGEFRRIVYAIDCDEAPDSPAGKGGPDGPEPTKGGVDGDGEGGSPSLIAALQNVFYRLQTAETAVNCRELMKSFGWDNVDAFTQHDAQELNRLLCDRLEEQMKGTPMDGSIKRLFEGEMENYIECIDVDYKSRRDETFYDIQLNIRGERGQDLKTIEESLREFTAEEILDGDNLYDAEKFGKQRARKGIRFKTFPPVLNLQLKRFHFDIERMDMVKLNTRFEFPMHLDLSSLAPGAGTYLLHAVVVHSGDVNSGHYFAYIRPDFERGWFKFDDDSVTPCSEFAAVEDNFGGLDLTCWQYTDLTPPEYRARREALGPNETLPPSRPRIHNAYMLVYIREDSAEYVLAPPDPMKTNPRMVERCNREVRLADERRKERQEQQSKIKIKLVSEADLLKMEGFWVHGDIPSSHSFKMSRDQTVKELATEVEKLTEIARSHIALFMLNFRHNPRQVRFAFLPLGSTLRSNIPQLSAPHFDANDPYLTVLYVAARGYSLTDRLWSGPPGPKPDELSKWNEDQYALLLVKYFCATTRKVVTLGCYYQGIQDNLMLMIADGWVVERLQPFIESKEVAPLPEDAKETGPTGNWECWEELSDRELRPAHKKKSLKLEQMWSGDIVIWQLLPPAASPTPAEAAGRRGGTADVPMHPEDNGVPVYAVNTVMDYLSYLQNSLDVAVTLHDMHQPLCADGVVANGIWGPPRPPSAQKDAKKEPGAASPTAKEEKTEDFGLANSPSKFEMPVEKELKMDLRWHLQNVTSAIYQTFNLKPPSPVAETPPEGQAYVTSRSLWLFHAAPANSGNEEPLNGHGLRNSDTTLKDIQRSAPYVSPAAGKKPLNLHAVEMPFRPGPDGLPDHLMPFCLRFFDRAVREVGMRIVVLNKTGTVQDLLQAAEAEVDPAWGIAGPLRALEIVNGRCDRAHLKPDTALRTMVCYARSNILFHCVRIETADADPDTLPEGHQLLEIFHCDRQSQQAFGQPLLLAVAPGEKAASLKARCKEILNVPEPEFKSWRLVRLGAGMPRAHLKDEEPWDAQQPSDYRLCLEHVHPTPTSSFVRTSRYSKPLTIK